MECSACGRGVDDNVRGGRQDQAEEGPVLALSTATEIPCAQREKELKVRPGAVKRGCRKRHGEKKERGADEKAPCKRRRGRMHSA
eukprot:115287-Pleurochrysis_carterae.AAC.6